MNRTQELFGKTNYDCSSEATTKNEDGFLAFERSLHETYLQMLMTNTLGNTFYVNKRDLLDRSHDLHKKMLKEDLDFMAKAVLYARNKGYMRLQPILGLAYVSTANDKSYFKAIFDSVIRTPGDLEDFVTICGSIRKGKGLGRSVKKTISKWLNNMSEYHAIKYGASRKVGWDLGDIIKVSHPNPKDENQGNLFNYVANGEGNISKLPQINELERVKNLASLRSNGSISDEKFSAQVIDAIEKGRLPWEIVTGIIKPSVKIWEYLMKQMPYFALLRNLNTLTRAGVLESKENVDYVVSRLTNEHAIKKSMIFPFRFYTALDNTDACAKIREALRDAAEISFSNVPDLKGSSHYFLDISGSMSGEYLKIGGVLGVAAFMKSEDPNFMCFESRLQYADLSKKDSLTTNLSKVLNLRQGGTNTGLCLQHMLGEVGMTSHWGWGGGSINGYHKNVPESVKSTSPIKTDNIIIITDEQQNAGSMVLSLFRKYKKKVNPNANLFVVNVAPYSGHFADKDEPGCHFIYGWSDQVLSYLSFAAEDKDAQVNHVKSIELRL